jgi:mRNA-degrading endonuclease RelE of RelBE toxin-antitoxin system
MSDGWDWRFTDRCERQLATLDDHARDRILSKLDEVVTDQ